MRILNKCKSMIYIVFSISLVLWKQLSLIMTINITGIYYNVYFLDAKRVNIYSYSYV